MEENKDPRNRWIQTWALDVQYSGERAIFEISGPESTAYL